MHGRAEELLGRLQRFAARCLKLCEKLPRGRTGRWVGEQLMRCSTSTGANYEEACAAESRADFLHKLQIVLKETRESRHWLTMVLLAEMMRPTRLSELMKEVNELVLILSKSVVTAKRNRRDLAEDTQP